MLVSALLLSYLARVAFGNLFPTLPPPTKGTRAGRPFSRLPHCYTLLSSVFVKPGACPPPSSITTSIVDPDDAGTCKTDNDCGAGTKKCCQSQAPSIYVCSQSSTGDLSTVPDLSLPTVHI